MASPQPARSPRLVLEKSEDGKVSAKRSRPEAVEIRCPSCGEPVGLISTEALAPPAPTT